MMYKQMPNDLDEESVAQSRESKRHDGGLDFIRGRNIYKRAGNDRLDHLIRFIKRAETQKRVGDDRMDHLIRFIKRSPQQKGELEYPLLYQML